MKILLLLFLLAMPLQAQSASSGDAIENIPFSLAYDYPSQNATRIYRDGILFKDFLITDVVSVATNVTYKIVIPGQLKGTYNFTATVVSNGIESLPSNLCVITVRPNAPGQLRKIP